MADVSVAVMDPAISKVIKYTVDMSVSRVTDSLTEVIESRLCTGLPRSGKSQGKTKIFQGQGKVREFCKKSGKISVLVKVSEKSGNFVFRLAQGFVKIMKTFSFGKLSCSGWSGASYVFKCKVFGQWFSL